MAEPRYSGPSAIEEVLAKTDPRLGVAYRANGFVDLPRYAAQLGAGMAESATLGLLKAPEDPQTTPEVLLRGTGHIIGSMFVPLGPAVKAASLKGISKPLAGAAANMIATEVQTRGEASLSRLMVDGAFGAIFGKFYGAKPAMVGREAGGIVAREAGRDPLRTVLPETETSRTLRMAQGVLRGKKEPEQVITSFRQMARFNRDPDVRQYSRRMVKFWDSINEGDVNINDLRTAWRDSLSGASASKPPTMEHSLESLVGKGLGEGELPLRMEPTGVSPLSALRPPKAVMMDVQMKTKGRIRAYTDIFEPAVDARRAASDEIGRVGKAVSEELRGVKKPKLQSMLQWLKTPESERQSVGNALGLTADEQQRALRVKDHVGRLWERNFHESFDDYVTGILPRIEGARPDQLEALRNHRTAGRMLQYAAASELKLESKDIGKFAAGHIRALAMMHHFDPTYRQLAGLTFKGEYPAEFRDYLTNWLRGLRGTDSSFAKAFNPSFRKFLTSLGVDASDADVRNVVNTYTQLTHAGLLGFRPGPLIRNMFNTWQTGSRIGLDWTWRGITKAMSKEGWSQAKAAGMIEEEVLHEVEGLRELGSVSTVTKTASAIAERGLRFYGKVDDFNRAAMYLGMRDKFLTAVKKGIKDESKFLSTSGLYRFHPVIRDQVMGMMRTKGVQDAAHLIGVHAAQDTQWVYRSGFRPTAMSGELNRAFLQFGVWPMNYLEYTRQMLTMPQTPTLEKAKWVGEWALANAGILGVFGAAGSAVGLGPDALHHTLGWTFVGPLSYTGGPLFDLLKSSEGFMIGAPEQTAAQAKRTAKETAIGAIPGSGLLRDVARAKGTGADMLQQAMGEDAMKALGMEYPGAQPSQSTEEEMFRFMTGIRRTQ